MRLHGLCVASPDTCRPSQRHRSDGRLMLGNDRWRLRGVNDHRVRSGPRIVPGRIDFLLAIGRHQQYRNHRAKQHSSRCQDSAWQDIS